MKNQLRLSNLWVATSIALILALVISFLPAQIQPVYAVSPNIVISKVYGGGGGSSG